MVLFYPLLGEAQSLYLKVYTALNESSYDDIYRPGNDLFLGILSLAGLGNMIQK